ncbi:MAG: P-II family nitrogen regulator [Deltaproteobacteria bacterium]|nr:P-II family nitrogen regulator [Deltaproteobacteria bacterium]
MFKKIKAWIDPLNLDEVQGALEDLGLHDVTTSNCRQVSPHNGPAMIFRGKERATDFLPEICLEIVVDQEMTGKVMETIQKAEGVGWDPQGKTAVLTIEAVLSFEPAEYEKFPGLGVGT